MKKKTYHNFMIIYRKMLKKGYDKAEAERITHRIFDDFAACPEGLSIRTRAEMIVPAQGGEA